MPRAELQHSDGARSLMHWSQRAETSVVTQLLKTRTSTLENDCEAAPLG